MTSPVISWPSVWPAGRGRAAAHHVLVAAADIGGDHLEDHPVLALTLLFRQRQLRIADVMHFDDARPLIDDTAIACHRGSFLLTTDTNLVLGAPTGTGAARVARAILSDGWSLHGVKKSKLWNLSNDYFRAGLGTGMFVSLATGGIVGAPVPPFSLRLTATDLKSSGLV